MRQYNVQEDEPKYKNTQPCTYGAYFLLNILHVFCQGNWEIGAMLDHFLEEYENLLRNNIFEEVLHFINTTAWMKPDGCTLQEFHEGNGHDGMGRFAEPIWWHAQFTPDQQSPVDALRGVEFGEGMVIQVSGESFSIIKGFQLSDLAVRWIIIDTHTSWVGISTDEQVRAYLDSKGVFGDMGCEYSVFRGFGEE